MFFFHKILLRQICIVKIDLHFFDLFLRLLPTCLVYIVARWRCPLSLLHKHDPLLQMEELDNKSLELQADTTAVLNKSLQLQTATPAVLNKSLEILPCTLDVHDKSPELQAATTAVLNKSLEFLPSTTAVLKKSLEIQDATIAVLTTSFLIGQNPRKPSTTAVLKLSLAISPRPCNSPTQIDH